jgi:hypothetical protein
LTNLDIFGGSSVNKQEVKPITAQTINTSLFDFTTTQPVNQGQNNIPTQTSGKIDTAQLLKGT